MQQELLEYRQTLMKLYRIGKCFNSLISDPNGQKMGSHERNPERKKIKVLVVEKHQEFGRLIISGNSVKHVKEKKTESLMNIPQSLDLWDYTFIALTAKICLEPQPALD